MSWLGGRSTEARLALMLLTRLPVGLLVEPLPPIGAARWAFPLAGLPVGALCWAAHAGALELGASPGLAAVLAVASGALVTGALHLDGLADLADGLGGGRDRAHRLEIMRDSRIGSFGAVALILVLAVAVESLAALGVAASLALFVATGALSRLAMVALLAALPPAREGGLGRAAQEGAGGAMAATLVALLLGLPTGLLLPVLLVPTAVTTAALGLLARRRLGGQTGDVLGASQVLTESAIWAALAIALA